MALENLSPFLWCLTLAIFIYTSGCKTTVSFALLLHSYTMLCLRCPLRISAKGFSDFPVQQSSVTIMGAQVKLARIYNSFVLNLLKLPRSNPEKKTTEVLWLLNLRGITLQKYFKLVMARAVPSLGSVCGGVDIWGLGFVCFGFFNCLSAHGILVGLRWEGLGCSISSTGVVNFCGPIWNLDK